RLRGALLHEGRAGKRLGEACRHPHARGRCFGIRDQTQRGKFVQFLGHQPARLAGNAWSGIVERDIAAAAGEDDRPGAADEPRSHDGNAFVYSHGTFLLSARSSLSMDEAPVQVTVPRSSTTVRSASASARSRWWSTMIIAISWRMRSNASNSSSVTAGD